MAILKERLKRRNESGGYDTIYLETDSSVVLMSDGASLETKFNEISNEIKNISSGPALSDTTPLVNGTVSAGTATTASRSDHVHPTDTTRAASSHNHAASNITSGTLVIARGGTGLTASPSMLTNLASTTAANILVASPRPGVTGTLPLANGGTGKTTAPLALYALINGSTALASTGLADTDVIGIGDVSAATGKKVTLANLASYLVSEGYVAGGSATGGVEVVTDVGAVVKWAGYTWIVVHVQDDMTYLALKNIYSTTIFGSNNTYKGSTLATVAANFQNSLPAAALAMCNNVTVEGVTAKVFVPTYAQCNGGFEYYSSNADRIAKNSAGTATAWWTCTGHGSSYVYYMGTGGNLYSGGVPSDSYGFRPHVALQL